MSSAITSATAAAGVTAPTAEDKKTADLKKAATGFETLLVKQMLATAKVAGKGEYSDMGVDAMANAVTQGGGLGLTGAIEKAIGHHEHQQIQKK